MLTGLGLLDFELLHALRRVDGLAGHPHVETPFIQANTGSLGMGISKAKGIATANRLRGQRRRIFVLTGDGELLAGIGSLATIGMQAPRNLGIVVIDNQAYGATGMQDTHTGHGVDLAAIARGSGFPGTAMVTTTGELDAVLPGIHHEPGPFLAVVKVQTKATTRIKVPNDGPYMRSRFRRALLGDAAGEATFYVRKIFVASSLLPEPADDVTHTATVPVLPARETIAKIDPDILICDIEGAELDVLPMLDLSRLRGAIVELHPQYIGLKGVQVVFDAMNAAGLVYNPKRSISKGVTFSRPE